MYFSTIFLKSPKEYLNFTTKKNMRGERAKDETFRNIFSRTLVITGYLKLKLGACQEELLHLKSG